VGRACKSERTCSYGLKNIRIKLEEKLPSFTQIRAISTEKNIATFDFLRKTPFFAENSQK
jgi:hypothetical protein